jgi:hypothetical protein
MFAGLGIPAWIGIGVGALCCVIITTVVLVFVCLSRRDKQQLEMFRMLAQQSNTASPPPPPAVAPEPYSVSNYQPMRSVGASSSGTASEFGRTASSFTQPPPPFESMRSARDVLDSARQNYGVIPNTSDATEYRELHFPNRPPAMSNAPQPVQHEVAISHPFYDHDYSGASNSTGFYDPSQQALYETPPPPPEPRPIPPTNKALPPPPPPTATSSLPPPPLMPTVSRPNLMSTPSTLNMMPMQPRPTLSMPPPPPPGSGGMDSAGNYF